MLERDAPYVQIIEHYRKLIASGQLRDGDMLPSGREIAAEFGVPSYLIEDAKALDPSWLDGVSAVGITAGASAPDELVEELVERLRELDQIEIQRLPGVTENVRFRMPAQLAEPVAGN